MSKPIEHVGSCTGGNTIPLDDEGRVYHFGCKAGEVANEVLIVSDYLLASEIAKNFEGDVFKRESNRGYHTYTGTYKGRRISVVAFGIGFAMIDFLVREYRAITTGPLTFIQLGSAPSPIGLELGTVVVVKDAVACQIDFENFTNDNPSPYKIFDEPVPSDNVVVAGLEAAMKVAQIPYKVGRVCSNPSFSAGVCAPSFASGGTGAFDFKTDGLMERITKECGEIDSLEMDTYPLLWTARRAAKNDISAGAISVVGADLNGKVYNENELHSKLLQIAPWILQQLGAIQESRA